MAKTPLTAAQKIAKRRAAKLKRRQELEAARLAETKVIKGKVIKVKVTPVPAPTRGTVKFNPSMPIKAQLPAFLDHIRNAPPAKNPIKKPSVNIPSAGLIRPLGDFVLRPEKYPAAFINTKKPFDELRSDIPVLLFPVRLETRFSQNNSVLRVRIFPDQLSIDSLDQTITPEELSHGKTFWKNYGKSKQDPAAQLAAWQVFASGFSAQRAAYVARAVKSGFAAKNIRKAGASPTSKAPLLPDRWMVTGYANGKVAFDVASRLIRKNLSFSPDLANTSGAVEGLAVDPAIKWMFDYDEAKLAGMALDIALPEFARKEISEIYVVGIKSKDPAQKSAQLSPQVAADMTEQLFRAHMYDWGAGFVPQGTATNNTDEVESGWSMFAPDLDALFQREITETNNDTAAPDLTLEPKEDEALLPVASLTGTEEEAKNYKVLEKILGLKPNSVLKQFEHRTGDETGAMAAMNTLLWPVTWGEMLGTMLTDQDKSFFTPDTIDWVRDWFCHSVQGGAPLPTIRVGSTPYGILPVSKTSLQRERMNTDTEKTRRQRLSMVLRAGLSDWQAGSKNILQLWEAPKKRLFSKNNSFNEPGERLLEILRQGPNPATYPQGALVNQRGLYDLRYEIRNLIVHPEHRSQTVRRPFPEVIGTSNNVGMSAIIAAYTTANPDSFVRYIDWPNKFTSGHHQKQVLAEKIQLLRDMQNPDSYLHGAAGISRNTIVAAIEQYVEPFKADYTILIGHLEEMLNICVEHEAANYTFDNVLDAPSELFEGIVGYESEDPPLSYLAYEPTNQIWHPSAYVTFPAKQGEVTLNTYMTSLEGYARSFISSTAAPAEPAFPEGKKPMLYRLLREAISRTGTDEDAGALVLRNWSDLAGDTSEPAKFDRDFADILGTIEARQLGELTEGFKYISGRKTGSRISASHDALARTLRATPPDRLLTISQGMDRDISARAKETAYPVVEMRALSAQVKALSKKPAGAFGKLTLATAPRSRRSKINQMIAAITRLKNLNDSQIELLMNQSLGLASWRLDAWLTAHPKREIDDLRAASKTRRGLQVGAFGWVHNLKPSTGKSTDPHRQRSQGFIHTPSLTHAKTAAVLRSGWNNYGSDAANSPAAVDLSSARMREADWMFNQVRQGQDMGDLLGYRFERHLKDKAQAADWIYPLRNAVLFFTGEKEDPTQPGVDGLELQRIWADEKKQKSLISRAQKEIEALGGKVSSASIKRLAGAVEYMDALADSLADAAVADSVHAMVQGNFSRSGASMSAISDGEVPPPELDILKTTPAALTQTHRVCLLAPEAGAGWGASAFSPRAIADPEAEALVSALLGAPKQLEFEGSIISADGGEITPFKVSWADMIDQKSPFSGGALDLMATLPEGGFSTECALAKRVAAHILAFGKTKNAPGVTVQFGNNTDELEEVLGRFEAWRRVVHNARSLHPRDFIIEGDELDGALLDVSGLEKRAVTARSQLLSALETVLKALPEIQEGEEQKTGKLSAKHLRNALDTLAQFGLNEAVSPLPYSAITKENTYAHAWDLAPNLRKIRKALKGLTPLKDAEPDQRIAQARKILRAIFGQKQPGLCSFVPTNLAAINAGFMTSKKRMAQTTGSAEEWIERLAYVKPSLRDFNDAMLMQDCSDRFEGGITLMVGQWPEAKPQPWIATAATTRGDATLSVVAAHVGPHVNKPEQLAGLVIDEIIDRIPASSINTGVALHYDAPNTESPQAMLLAVPPPGENWSYDTMVDTVRDAFNMAKMRPVDGHAMQSFNQILPAIYGSKNFGTGGTP